MSLIPGWQMRPVASVLVRKRRAGKPSRCRQRLRTRDAFGPDSLVRVVWWNLNYRGAAGVRLHGETAT
jgi:hypothetical protein